MIYEAEKGENFYSFGNRMKEEMKLKGQSYRVCIFNEIHYTIGFDSNMDDIATIYDLKRKLKHGN